VGRIAGEGLLYKSLSVTVMVDNETPSAMTGPVPVMLELAETGEPPIKMAVPPVFATGVRRLRVLTSAFVDFRVHVDKPVAFVAEQVP
jgi:hypothetical protein